MILKLNIIIIFSTIFLLVLSQKDRSHRYLLFEEDTPEFEISDSTSQFFKFGPKEYDLTMSLSMQIKEEEHLDSQTSFFKEDYEYSVTISVSLQHPHDGVEYYHKDYSNYGCDTDSDNPLCGYRNYLKIDEMVLLESYSQYYLIDVHCEFIGSKIPSDSTMTFSLQGTTNEELEEDTDLSSKFYYAMIGSIISVLTIMMTFFFIHTMFLILFPRLNGNIKLRVTIGMFFCCLCCTFFVVPTVFIFSFFLTFPG